MLWRLPAIGVWSTRLAGRPPARPSEPIAAGGECARGWRRCSLGGTRSSLGPAARRRRVRGTSRPAGGDGARRRTREACAGGERGGGGGAGWGGEGTIILTRVRPRSMASSSLSARTSLMALNSLTMRSGLRMRSSRMLALRAELAAAAASHSCRPPSERELSALRAGPAARSVERSPPGAFRAFLLRGGAIRSAPRLACREIGRAGLRRGMLATSAAGLRDLQVVEVHV
jgi:hypothetical protein